MLLALNSKVTALLVKNRGKGTTKAFDYSLSLVFVCKVKGFVHDSGKTVLEISFLSLCIIFTLRPKVIAEGHDKLLIFEIVPSPLWFLKPLYADWS